MITGVGTDIELLKRFKDNEKNRKFLELIFTERERDYCNKKKNSYISYAGKFCAKESVVKALGKKMHLREIEIINNPEGKPQVYVRGKLNKNINCSISHAGGYAIAYVVINKNGK
jgi:holo-[acyl-carrier protein] synthase